MANYVKISTLGPPMQSDPDPSKPQQAVDRMIAFWKDQLGQVLPDRPDLIVVPEVCDWFENLTGQQRLDYYRVRGNQVRDFFAGVAREHHCNVAYSAVRQVDQQQWANTTQIIGRDGRVRGMYNKNHTVISETLEDGISSGTESPLIECDFGRVACAICFDLNFDELRLKYARARPDLIVFCSVYHGGLMQAYWAYSCRAHFVGAICNLPCEIISPLGRTLARSTNYFHYATAAVNLDCRMAHLDFNRERMQAAKDKYGPKITITDPGLLGSVLISSESDQLTADDVVKEFEIELLDDYFQRSLALHHDEQYHLRE